MAMDPSGLELLAEPGWCLERDARGGPYQLCDPLAVAKATAIRTAAACSGRLRRCGVRCAHLAPPSVWLFPFCARAKPFGPSASPLDCSLLL